jgi:hypothetical protein
MRYYTEENIKKYKEVIGGDSEIGIKNFLTGAGLAIMKPGESHSEFVERTKLESAKQAIKNIKKLGITPDHSEEAFLETYEEPDYLTKSRMKMRNLYDNFNSENKRIEDLPKDLQSLAVELQLKFNLQ